MVEFALVLPLLVMLVFGIIEFGRAYNTTISLRAAAREGARTAALATGPDGWEQAKADTVAAAPSVPGLTTDNVTVEAAACLGGGDGKAVVTVSVPFELNLPFVAFSTGDLSGTGVMRCGL